MWIQVSVVYQFEIPKLFQQNVVATKGIFQTDTLPGIFVKQYEGWQICHPYLLAYYFVLKGNPFNYFAVIVTGTDSCALCPAESVAVTFKVYVPVTGVAQLSKREIPVVKLLPLAGEIIIPSGTPVRETDSP